MQDTNKDKTSGETKSTETEATTSETGTVSAAVLQEALSGLEFPASRQELVDQANDNGAESTVISALQKLPDRQYHAVTEIQQAFTGVQA